MARIVFNQADNDCQERSERSNIKNFMYSNKNFYMVLDNQDLFDRFVSHTNREINKANKKEKEHRKIEKTCHAEKRKLFGIICKQLREI